MALVPLAMVQQICYPPNCKPIMDVLACGWQQRQQHACLVGQHPAAAHTLFTPEAWSSPRHRPHNHCTFVHTFCMCVSCTCTAQSCYHQHTSHLTLP